MTVESLPVELWLIILSLAKEMIIAQSEDCDHIPFPTLYHQIRDPRNQSKINGSCRQLRLVCRMFKALLGSSPEYFLVQNNNYIPSGTRIITVVLYSTLPLCFQRIIRQQTIAIHIVTLQFPCRVSQTSSGSGDFDLLCSNSGLLPNIRSLALNFYNNTEQSRIVSFWVRLNASFPLLVSLALLLSNHVYWARLATFSSYQDPVTIFERLQVLIIDNLGASFQIQLPAVRHIALASPGDIYGLKIGPKLESLLFLGQENLMRGIVRAKNLPPLQLLGIPFSNIVTPLPLPENYPLQHLCIFFISPSYSRHSPVIYYLLPKLLPWIELQMKCFPSLSQITLDTTMSSSHDQAGIESLISSAKPRFIGLLVPPFVWGQRSVVLERDPLFTPPHLAPKKSGKRGLKFGLL